MGTAFTIDTPLKVAQYGIDSVIALADDVLLERLRAMYCKKNKLPYEAIDSKADDSRAKRITSYLNLINKLVEERFNKFTANIKSKSTAFDLLPNTQILQKEFNRRCEKWNLENARDWLKSQLSIGSIDVNIMTKVDRPNYVNNQVLPSEYNDAHAALRGYANSKLSSSVIFSAGMNPRLYHYVTQFEDFFPNKENEITKKIVLKVSDFRSALIQGKFLAKKGLWVSEYRIESGLNCGGHAFATDGFLMGPILAEFRDKRKELIESTHAILTASLNRENKHVPDSPLPLKISTQGGVGTAEEHAFLLKEYQLDSIGWGTPFLLVPEATTVDSTTLKQLQDAKENDLYLSNISPLGVPFNNLKNNTQDLIKQQFIDKGRPGSSCPKKCLALNTELSEKGLCTASRQYQYLKIKELDNSELTGSEYQNSFQKIVEKACLCIGLAAPAILSNKLNTTKENVGVSVCPGPNMAYFSEVMSLNEICQHIYGFSNVIKRTDRPHMFIKELWIYIDYLKQKIKENKNLMNQKQEKYFSKFTQNLSSGISYYHNLFEDSKDWFEETKKDVLQELEKTHTELANVSSGKSF